MSEKRDNLLEFQPKLEINTYLRCLELNGFRDVGDSAVVKLSAVKCCTHFRNVNWLECHNFYTHVNKVNEFYSTQMI